MRQIGTGIDLQSEIAFCKNQPIFRDKLTKQLVNLYYARPFEHSALALLRIVAPGFGVQIGQCRRL